VVSICEGDALREASYFTDRLRAEHMPLAGLILNRTHPPLADLAAGPAQLATDKLGDAAPLAAAVLDIHRQRLEVRAAELHMRGRFDRVHSDLPVVEVPALPSDAHDLPALREIGLRLTHGTSYRPAETG
jgi:anion-transporting  ArsA/GET3 family ATPase